MRPLELDVRHANLTSPAGGRRGAQGQFDIYVDSVRTAAGLPAGRAAPLSSIALAAVSPFIHVTAPNVDDLGEALAMAALDFFDEETGEVNVPLRLALVIAGSEEEPLLLAHAVHAEPDDPEEVPVTLAHAAADLPPVTIRLLDQSRSWSASTVLVEDLAFGAFADLALGADVLELEVTYAGMTEVVTLDLSGQQGQPLLAAIAPGEEGAFEFVAFMADGTGVGMEPGDDGASSGRLVALHPAYPNPGRTSVTIGFELREAAEARLEVFDLLGRRVALVLDRPMAAGRHEVDLPLRGFAAGIYLYRLEAGEQQVARRFTVLR